jgi:pyruvate, orthophosphate dikinase
MKEGDWVSIDGTTGEVFLGQADTKDPDPNSPVFAKFMKMADEFRGNFGVRANADIPRDAKAARKFGAEGIGLCRTEHMFFAEDRLPHVQAMILSDNEKDRRKALAKLLPMQRKDFAGLFEAMDGFPVVIRTLDPPLHEFVPKREELMVDIAKLPTPTSRPRRKWRPLRQLRRRSEEPQDRAARTAEARRIAARVQPDARPPRLPSRHHLSGDHRDAGARHLRSRRSGGQEGQEGHPRSHDPADRFVQELEHQKAIVKRVADEVLEKAGSRRSRKYLIGTMIEIPRAALTGRPGREGSRVLQLRHQRPDADHDGSVARRLHEVLEGLRRQEDLQGRPVRRARPGRRRHADQVGCGEGARQTRPDLEVGICGEHGGEPSSVEFCYRVGMDYVSCSPYRVPIARLAAAQATSRRDLEVAKRRFVELSRGE